jgi:hypothetical protein
MLAVYRVTGEEWYGMNGRFAIEATDMPAVTVTEFSSR